MSELVPATEAVTSFDHLVGTGNEYRRNVDTEYLCRPEVDDELKFRRRFHWQISGPRTLEYLVDIDCGTAEEISVIRSI
jgi:hypothetical protein